MSSRNFHRDYLLIIVLIKFNDIFIGTRVIYEFKKSNKKKGMTYKC